jgi:small multidrug resistance pump
VSGWAALALAIACEIAATLALRASHGFTRPLPVVLLVAGYASSFYCLALALRTLSLATAYAIWSAVGIAVLTAVGIVAFGESRSVLKLVSLALVVAGIAGLRTTQ